MSTTQLVSVTGFAIGTVGNHLKILLDAQLVHRRRAARSVLYYRTADGDRLIRAATRLDTPEGGDVAGIGAAAAADDAQRRQAMA
jgi:DNA-binding transcriptional ArsR family regulator